VTPELAEYLARLEDLRGQIVRLVDGLPTEALNWRPLEEAAGRQTNSLAALAAHCAGAERFWIGQVVGGGPPNRDRDAELAWRATSSTELIRLLEDCGQETRVTVSALEGTALAGLREVDGQRVSVRWCLLHVLDHTALHLGHMQLTFQLGSGGRCAPSPLWFERIQNPTGDS
jgi:uncharacterized damage-inducible protein DinB